MPDEETIKGWGAKKDRVFLPGKPLELNFVMRPSGRVAGRLVDERIDPSPDYSVALNGAELPPSSSVVASVKTDEQGRFAIEDIPTTYRFQFEVRKADPKPPWDDSWAGAALRFERPEKGDLRAWFGEREIRLQELVIRVAGPGVHGRSATPIAGNVGVLDLTAADPADVSERGDKLLVARSAVLTLRNASRRTAGRWSRESVPAATKATATRLARTRPNDAGECTISFENPSEAKLEPGKNQVIFQVFVGASQEPIREKIFRQLDVRRDGRYEVPVKIPPDAIDDSRVSITFLTIQPDHDAWVKAFFLEGKGKGYQGLWLSDGGMLPAIPFEPAAVK